LRPALLPAAVLPALHELRKFRRFFRNAYVLQLDPAKVRARVRDLEVVAGPVAESLERFVQEVAGDR